MRITLLHVACVSAGRRRSQRLHLERLATLTHVFLYRCVISQTGTAFPGRSLCVANGRWLVSNQSTDANVRNAVWTFVAAVFDDLTYPQTIQLFVDGSMYDVASDALVSGRSAPTNQTLLGSAESSFSGFRGALKNVFIYKSTLSAEELAYLMATSMDPLPVIAGHWGNAFYAAEPNGQLAYLSIPTGPIIAANGSLSLWLALVMNVNDAICVVQFVMSLSDDLSVCITFDDSRAVAYLRVVRSSSDNSKAEEWLFPTAALGTSGAWEHLVIEWSGDTLRVFIDNSVQV